jgi:serine/threonine protein kinase
METERWLRVEELYLAALNIKEDERPSFLAEVCGLDLELRDEIESLLSYENDTKNTIESLALGVALEFLAECKTESSRSGQPRHSEVVGKMVAHYRILEELGAGGVGVVYKAEDTKLGRFVALKFLAKSILEPSSDSRVLHGPPYDPAALERFEREARASSALDHPNICMVHDVGEQEGCPYIVMQFLPGQTLKQEVGGKALATDRIVDWGFQMADALDAAHSAGIVHRDIKSANVFVTQRGEVKILDFGLAKIVASRPPASPAEPVRRNSTMARTCDETLSRRGIPFGTASYMSPEQIRGEEVDARSDLFSLGVVLYEMATGTVPFKDLTVAAVFEDILHQKPVPVSELNPGLPKELERVIDKAMEKSLELRYQTAGDLRDDLRRLKMETGASAWVFRANVAVAVVLLVLALVVGYLVARGRTTSSLTEPNTIVLADFNNATGEALLGQTLKRALRVQLEQSPFLSVLSEERISRALSYMGLWRDTKLTDAVAKEVCLRTGSSAVVEGSISTLGSRYVVGLQAVNCQTGEVVGSEHAEAEGDQRILSALGDAATRLRASLGESFVSIKKYDTPVEGATTASLDALQAYSLAMEIMDTPGSSPIPLLKRATELDPNFAMAYARLGNEYFNFNQPSLGSAAITRAYELRERVSKREKFYIESHYYADVTGQIEKAVEVYQLWRKNYPRDLIPHLNLINSYSNLGEYDKGVLEGQEALRLSNSDPRVYVNLGVAYLNLNQFDKAAELLNEAKSRKVDDALFVLIRYQLAFAQDNHEEMERLVASAAGKPGMEGWLLALQADTEAYHGHLARAREFTKRAIESAGHDGDEETALSYAAIGALREAEFGNRGSATRQVTAALKPERGQQVSILSALALARAGTTQKALALARNLNQQFPKDTLLNAYWLPTIRAAVELRANKPFQAIESLEPARYELAAPRLPTNVLLYPLYLRGSAYLAAGFADKARAEFQKILDHPGLTSNYLLGAAAHLGLGRAYAMEAGIPIMPAVRTPRVERDRRQALERPDALAKGRAAYQSFFALWKDADPNIPVLRQARLEYHKLQ